MVMVIVRGMFGVGLELELELGSWLGLCLGLWLATLFFLLLVNRSSTSLLFAGPATEGCGHVLW